MTDLLAARLTMAVSLGFHIVLAAIGMVMPMLMAAAHRRYIVTGDEQAKALTKLWMRGVAIFFATGAVSGTALSFELGILWPGFMEHAGPIIGMPFSLEGAAFFIEAIALGIYMYGWDRLSPRVHWWSGVVVAMAGVSSGILVVSANGWMNSPSGFLWDGETASQVDPWAALFNAAWFDEALHMVLAAIESVGFAVAGVHAYLLLRLTKGTDDTSDEKQADPNDRAISLHRRALRIALAFGAVAALLQPLSGHMAAQGVAERQPAKLAAMEAHFHTSTRAPLLVGGIPDEEEETVSMALEIPGGLSFLAFDDPDAEVTGLDAFAAEDRPPVAIVHYAFQVMVGIGSWLMFLGALALIALLRRPAWLRHRRFLQALWLSAPLGFLAIEAGWTVTEVGRQPWIIHGVMRTADALTPVPGQVWHLAMFSALYLLIGVSCAWMWRRQVRATWRVPVAAGPEASPAENERDEESETPKLEQADDEKGSDR